MKEKTKKTESKPIEDRPAEDESNWITCQTCGSVWDSLPGAFSLRLMMCPICADDFRDKP